MNAPTTIVPFRRPAHLVLAAAIEPVGYPRLSREQARAGLLLKPALGTTGGRHEHPVQ